MDFSEQPDLMLSAALDYAMGKVFGRAVSVFPLAAGTNAPAIAGGHSFHDASIDPDQVTKWWARYPGANIGLALAPNGLCAVDIDGPRGHATWSNLGAEYPGPVSCCTETPSGGGHIIYTVPEGRTPRGKVGVFPSVDLRGPGYLCAPPSVRPDGVYRWVMPPWRLAPQPAPGWILHPVGAPDRPPLTYTPSDEHTRYGRAALDGIVAEIANAPKGQRNDTLHARACRVGELVTAGHLSEPDAVEAIRRAAASAGLGWTEIDRAVMSAFARIGRSVHA